MPACTQYVCSAPFHQTRSRTGLRSQAHTVVCDVGVYHVFVGKFVFFLDVESACQAKRTNNGQTDSQIETTAHDREIHNIPIHATAVEVWRYLSGTNRWEGCFDDLRDVACRAVP